jgi:hypothetical protein
VRMDIWSVRVNCRTWVSRGLERAEPSGYAEVGILEKSRGLDIPQGVGLALPDIDSRPRTMQNSGCY